MFFILRSLSMWKTCSLISFRHCGCYTRQRAAFSALPVKCQCPPPTPNISTQIYPLLANGSASSRGVSSCLCPATSVHLPSKLRKCNVFPTTIVLVIFLKVGCEECPGSAYRTHNDSPIKWLLCVCCCEASAQGHESPTIWHAPV